MIRITIGRNRQCVLTACDSKMIVFPANARFGKELRPLSECAGVRDTEVEIILKRGIFWKRLPLTREIQEGILEFLGDYSARSDWIFDCYAFVNMVNNVPPHKTEHLLGFWEITPLAGAPTSGQTVFLLTEETSSFHHAAMYLGYGFYVSVYGYGGNLEISTLNDMRRDFGAKDVVTATPRKRTAAYF